MTLDIHDELLLTRLVFGFLRFTPSLVGVGVSKALSSPKTGVLDPAPFAHWAPSPSLLVSCELRDSFSLSLMLYVARSDLVLPESASLYSCGGLRGFVLESDIFTPVVAGRGAVASGFGFAFWCSDGCGGGIARCRSSCRTYVPDSFSGVEQVSKDAAWITFTNSQLILWTRRMAKGVTGIQCNSGHRSWIIRIEDILGGSRWRRRHAATDYQSAD